MSPEIYIDVSGVPPQLQSTPLFRADLAEMRAALNKESKVMAFCVHEAGHYIYFLKMGVPDHAFAFKGPRIRYVQEHDKIYSNMAAVEPDLNAIDMRTFEKGEDVALALAKAASAGGVYAARLTSEQMVGDEQDRVVFQAHFRDICKLYPQTVSEQQEQHYWDRGREEVSRDLRSPQARDEAWTAARRLRPLLFRAHA